MTSAQIAALEIFGLKKKTAERATRTVNRYRFSNGLYPNYNTKRGFCQMEFKEKLAEAIKDFSAEELRDLLAFIRALKSGVVKSSSDWIALKAETAIEGRCQACLN